MFFSYVLLIRFINGDVPVGMPDITIQAIPEDFGSFGIFNPTNTPLCNEPVTPV